MDTDLSSTEGFFWWRDVSPADWAEIRETAHSVAASHAEFGYDKRIDGVLMSEFNEKARSYTRNYVDSKKVVEQRPFIQSPASRVMKYGILESWLNKGPSQAEINAGYGYVPPPTPPCGPGNAGGDGSYIECDTGQVAWLPGKKPDWAK